MSNYSFSVMPSVSISRSRFERKSQHKTSFNVGEIIPIYLDEVLPGDTRSLDLAALVRMSAPIAPIMDNIYMDIFAFFVPNRLTWVHWKEFMGENNTSAGIPSSTYVIPCIDTPVSSNYTINSGSYGDYFGLPLGGVVKDGISALPFRALALIYNRWFRNQNVVAPLAVDTSDNNNALLSGNNAFCCTTAGILKASKLPDYFTSALPYAQKGTAVSIPLGTTADVLIKGNTSLTLPFASPIDVTNTTAVSGTGTAGVTLTSSNLSGWSGKLVADLTNATAATINQLRYAFQLQKLLEKDALYGSRYWEILAAHFGVTAPDASLQDPEYLGGRRININIDQVLSTAGYDASNLQEVGQVGANSVTGFKGSIFTKSFVEHGHIIIVGVVRHDQTYMQGINRMWSRKTRYDFYMPVFANLGAQDIKNKEIYADGTSADDSLFGYQEAWAEYRYKPSIATGKLRPISGGFPFWTLTNNFASLPTLGQTFIEQSRDNIQRALVTGSTGPDFIADFFFKDVAVRPMPVYSVPGLIDHH